MLIRGLGIEDEKGVGVEHGLLDWKLVGIIALGGGDLELGTGGFFFWIYFALDMTLLEGMLAPSIHLRLENLRLLLVCLRYHLLHDVHPRYHFT